MRKKSAIVDSISPNKKYLFVSVTGGKRMESIERMYSSFLKKSRFKIIILDIKMSKQDEVFVWSLKGDEEISEEE